MRHRPNYLGVFLTFARNSLIRDMTFRGNFLAEVFTSIMWTVMTLCLYIIIFEAADELGRGTGWGKYQFFIFLSTTMFVNSIMQTLFMPNTQEFSELIRTGRLDFILLKPIDSQFLISLHKIEWSSLSNMMVGVGLLVYSLFQLGFVPHLYQIVLYPLYILCGVVILYSLIITLAATSVWMGRNQSLYDFWFYITTFSRYPMEIYQGRLGVPLRHVLTFAIPILIAINVPARLLAKPLDTSQWRLAVFAIVATMACLVFSRRIFLSSLKGYRSASS